MPDQIMKALKLKEGQNIADIGSGGGYFSIRFAQSIGRSGKVFAVDTDPDLLESVEESAAERGIGNIETVLVEDRIPGLPEGIIDLIFIRNVTHHIENRAEYFKQIKPSLSEDGRIAIIE